MGYLFLNEVYDMLGIKRTNYDVQYSISCKLYLAGNCFNGGIETNGPLSIKESLQCKMIDIEKTAKNSGIAISNANEEVLKAALIMDSEQENCYIIFNRKSWRN